MTVMNIMKVTSMMIIFMAIWINIDNKMNSLCLILIIAIMMTSLNMSVMMSNPIPQIIFLTMIGGLMVIFLYLMVTMYTHKKYSTPKMINIIKLSVLLTPMMMLKMITKSNYNIIPVFNNNFNMFSITLITLLTIILIMTIKIHFKANSQFRRKLKIWN